MRSALPLLVLCAVVGCSSKEPFAESPRAVASLAAPEAKQVTETIQRRLVKTVAMDLRVTDTTAASERLQKLAVELGGHVGSMTADRRNGTLFYQMTLRIPEARLDDALTRIKGLADRTDHEMVNQEDVTEKYVDLAARMKTLEATEIELRGLLSESRQRQQKAEDIMAIYRQLTEIRSNIEQIHGQLNVMDNLTSLATVNLNLFPTESPTVAVSSWRPFETVQRSFQYLVSVLTGLADLAITISIVIVPPALILGLVIWLGMKGWNAARGRSA